MPNVGRPSKGCKSCRDRKVKCDQKRPSCSQCIRAGKECHGYRDALSMMFKNESDVVAKKAEKRYEKLAKQKTQSYRTNQDGNVEEHVSVEWAAVTDGRLSSSSKTPFTPSARYLTPESMISEIAPCVEDQALGFFVAHYVAQPSIVPRGQFEWIMELLGQPKTEDFLRSSVSAVSLAALGNASKSPIVRQKAQKAYVDALQVINRALQSRETAVQDSTLVAVILLGIYENMVFEGKQSIQAWAKHVAGACALLKMRGKEQFQSSIARRIFHQFYGVVLLVALETGSAVHHGMQELYEALHPTSDYDVHGRQWTTRVVNVMHDAINLNHDKESDPTTMVHAAVSIDRKLDAIKALMPSIWRYETVVLDLLFEYQYGTSYHVYVDPWIAQMWNNLRSCRMYLYRSMRENLTKGFEQYNPPLFSASEVRAQKEDAEEVMRETIAGIVASVPQITGMIPFPKAMASGTDGPFFATPGDELTTSVLHPPGTFLDPAKSTGMVHLIWPLYAVGQCDLSSYEMRQWCIEILHFIALRIGTRQAVVLANELSEMQTRESAPTKLVLSDNT